MKARELKRLLETNYIVHDLGDRIAIGSPMVSDLISVSKEGFRMKYALGSESDVMKKEELSQIWVKLKDFIKSGRLASMIDGKDAIENPLTVYSVENGQLLEHVTDAYGWPNVTDSGVLMHNNTHFRSIEKAIKYGIEDVCAAISQMDDNINEFIEKLARCNNRKKSYQENLASLRGLEEEIDLLKNSIQ